MVKAASVSTLLLFLPVLASAGAGNAVRNGGTSVRCGSSAPVLLDRFEAAADSVALAVPSTDEVIRERFQYLSAIDPLLSFTIAANFRSFGSASGWASLPGHVSDGSRPEVSRNSKDLLQAFFGRYYPHRELRHAGGEATYDELPSVAIPDDCRYEQVAVFDGKRPFRTESTFDLGSTDLRLLEFHEAVYAAGYSLFGHRNSRLARELIREWLVGIPNRDRLAEVAVRFRGYRSDYARFREANGAVEGAYYANDPTDRCPKFSLAVYAGGNLGVYDFEMDSERSSILERFAEVTVAEFRRMLDRCGMKRFEIDDTLGARGRFPGARR